MTMGLDNAGHACVRFQKSPQLPAFDAKCKAMFPELTYFSGVGCNIVIHMIMYDNDNTNNNSNAECIIMSNNV